MSKTNENQNIFSESDTIKKSLVKLTNSWSFWENYEPKDQKDKSKLKQKGYDQTLKEIITFDDIITFWQFWNNYPGSNFENIFFDGTKVKYFFEDMKRIISINLFLKDVLPQWEDDHNNGGRNFQLEYMVKETIQSVPAFLNTIKDSFLKLICELIGGSMPQAEFINGIRFVDKVDRNSVSFRKFIFRIEVWTRKGMNNKQEEDLKKYLEEQYKSYVVIKDIKV